MPMNPRLLVPRASRLLLDVARNAVAACSLRQLSSSYVGPIVTVRRSSDNAEADFTAGQVANGSLVAWVGAGNSGFVKQWWDQSGRGNHFIQTTAGNQPRIVVSGIIQSPDGIPSILFSGKALRTTAGGDFAYGTGGFFVTALVRPQTDAFEVYFSQSAAGNNYFFVGQDTGKKFVFIGTPSGGGTPQATSNDTLPLFVWKSVSARRVGSSALTLTVNGQDLVADTNTTNFSDTTRSPSIGAYSHTVAANTFTGFMAEMIVYKKDIVDAEKLLIENNINRHYRIF
jgi:hypothetical protein